MFLPPPNVFWSFQAVLSIPINKCTYSPQPEYHQMPCLCLLFLIPSGFMIGTIFLSPVWAQMVKTCKPQTDPLLSVPVLGLPHCTREPQQQGKPRCATSLLVWRGRTVELALTQHRRRKLQRQNPSKNRLFKDLNQQTQRVSVQFQCKLKFFEGGFSEKQYCPYKSSSSSKGLLQSRGLDPKIRRSQSAAAKLRLSSYLPSPRLVSGFGRYVLKTRF